MKAYSIINFVGLVLLLSIHWEVAAQLQNLQFEHLSAKDGLSSNYVMSIHQDKEGFMWFGTDAGLNKYDGYTFTVFNMDPKNPQSTLKTSHIYDIHEDHTGRLWIAAYGLHLMDKRTGNITAYLADSVQFTYLNIALKIVEDENEILWFSAGGGLNRFNPATKQFTSFLTPKLVPNLGLAKDSSGMFWMGADVNLYKFDPQTESFTRFSLMTGLNLNCSITALLVDTEGILWIGTAGAGLFRLDTKLKQPQATPYNPTEQVKKSVNLNGIYEDRSGYLWLATTDGLQRIDKHANTIITYRADPARTGGLSSNNVLSVYEDSNGTLWVGTNNGIDKVINRLKPFLVHQITYTSRPILHNENIISTLLEDKEGIIWLGTYNGLYKYQSVNNQISYVSLTSGDTVLNGFNNINKPYYTEIDVIHQDYLGRLWVGTENGLYLLNRTTGKFSHYPCKIPVFYMAEDPFGKLWIPGGYQESGVAVMAEFNLHSLTFNYTEYTLNDSAGLKDMYLRGIMASRSGDLWVATQSYGISRMDHQTRKFKYYLPDSSSPNNNINSRFIWSLYEDKKGKIWAGTNHAGLYRLDPVTGTFNLFTTHEGLASNIVISIAEDKGGNLWLGTDKGLSRFNPNTKTFRNFDISDGLPENGLMLNAVFRSKEKLLFGSNNGFLIFNPDSIKENKVAPLVYLTNLKVLEKNIPIPDSVLELPYNKNFLSFDFVGLNYDSPEKNQYAYQLVGLDKNWIYSGTRRYASYPGLAPGTYTFKAKASNNDGIWNEKGTSLIIIIHPPWWQTWWAYLLWTVIILALLYSIYYIRISRLRELLQVRNKIAHDLHDDVGSTLSSISIMSEMAKRKTPESSVLLERIGSNAQQMQENMSDIVWAINPKNDHFEDVLKRMKMFASEMLEAKNIALHFCAEEALYHQKLSMSQRRNLYFIFKEAITNAAKYAAAANVMVKVSLQNRMMELLVKDDGKGFDAAYQTMGGNGLYNMQKRAEDLNGILKIDSIKGRGTAICLQFKIS
jgi:ligand-binding sensor domain-containing protein/two-component sensor histidine kinase